MLPSPNIYLGHFMQYCQCLVSFHSTTSESSRGPSDRVLCLADQSSIQHDHASTALSVLYLVWAHNMATSSLILAARSVTSAATITTRSVSEASPTESTLDDYNYQTSKIVRIAIVSGVIVLVITGIVLFFKVSPSTDYNIQLTSRSPHGFVTTVVKDDRSQFNNNFKMNKGRTHMR